MGPNYYIVEDFKNLLTVHVTFSRSFKGRNINGVAYELGQYALSLFIMNHGWRRGLYGFTISFSMNCVILIFLE